MMMKKKKKTTTTTILRTIRTNNTTIDCHSNKCHPDDRSYSKPSLIVLKQEPLLFSLIISSRFDYLNTLKHIYK